MHFREEKGPGRAGAPGEGARDVGGFAVVVRVVQRELLERAPKLLRRDGRPRRRQARRRGRQSCIRRLILREKCRKMHGRLMHYG